MEINPETTELKNMVQNLSDLVVQVSKDVNRELSVSRRNFLKLGVGSFFGTYCDATSAIIGVDAARRNCSPCQTLHRPIHERWRESIEYL